MTEANAQATITDRSDSTIRPSLANEVVSSTTIDEEESIVPLDEENWQDLLLNLHEGRCTPFLGAGASRPPLPTAAGIAKMWAEEFNYPLDDREDLSRVSQFLAVTRSPRFPKMKIRNYFNQLGAPDFHTENQIHALLAELPIPVYVTTNYDDFMERALQLRGKTPKLEMCRWNKLVRGLPSALTTNPEWRPTPDSPMVFHLHGYKDVPDSLVLTEDDYVDFLIEMDQEILPKRIHEAFAGDSLLFLGYGLGDWNFRVLFRTLSSYMEKAIRPAHVSVQLAPLPKTVSKERKAAVLKYLNTYFSGLDIRVYWGTCQQFARDLQARWRVEYGAGAAAAHMG